MAFNLEKFYIQLDEHYAAHNNSATEAFLLEAKQKAYDAGIAYPLNDSCPSCVAPLEPNMAYVSVCNELACFYRGLSRWQESLESFDLAQQELESLYRQNTPEYATLLLNKAGTYRYKGDLDGAVEHFTRAARIFEQNQTADPQVLAGLYNNVGLVYLDKQQPEQALQYFQLALPLVSENMGQIVELGTTWNNLANAYSQLGQNDQAAEAIQNAVDILSKLDGGVNPHYPAALNTHGVYSYRAGQYEAALTDFTEALEKTRLVYGENIEYVYACGNCAAVCHKLGREDEARRWEDTAAAIRTRLGQA